MVNFELRYALRQPESKGDDFRARYDACVEQCDWADKLGFSSVMISEHHGSPDGYMCSPMVIGGAIAARTTNMRIRIAALIVPLHNMTRVAEDLATLDILSNGRVDPCISGGYVGYEFEAMGLDLSIRKKYMDDIVPFLKNAWSGEPFEYEGRTICVRPRPVQRPHLPIWMGGASHVAARRAARHADVFLPAHADYYVTFLEECEKIGRTPPEPRGESIMVWVAEDPDAFWAKYGPSALHENNAYGKWYADWGAWNGYVTCKDTDELRATGRYPIVTPDELVQKAKDLGPNGTVMLHPMAGGGDPDLAWESLELVKNKVMPALEAEEASAA